jgi:asparagine synthase (glutamine-hydrolysing)
MGERPKWGFSLPMTAWMKRELRPFLDETFSEASLARCGFFHCANTQKLWRDFLAGDDARQWSRIWSVAVMIAFANRRRLA